MSITAMKGTHDWDSEYQEIVLKVPDGLGVEKGAITKEMQSTGKEMYKVISMIH